MHLVRWLIVASLLSVSATPLLGCRKPLSKPFVGETGGSTGGRGGAGGMGRTDGAGGTGVVDAETAETPPPDAPEQPRPDAAADRPDIRLPDGPDPCGQAEGPCCPGDRCEGGRCCYLGTCVAVGQRCPEEEFLTCYSSSCGGRCGGLLQGCCGDAGYCTAPLTACSKTDASARCESCGNTGEACCRNNYCEPPNRRCVNGRCVSP